MNKQQFFEIANEIEKANDSAQLMKSLFMMKERKLINADSFMDDYKTEASKLSDALATIIMLTGLDDLLKDSLTN